MTLQEKIESALRGVEDPGTHLDVMRMRLIRDLGVDRAGRVHLTFQPSSPDCPMAFKLAHAIQQAVKQVDGVKGVDLKVSGYSRADEIMDLLSQS